MTIQEAIKSGKKFRRADGSWAKVFTSGIYWDDPQGGSRYFLVEELLADDWEIEEKKVEITYERLQIAHKNCLASSAYSIDALAKELGLL